MSKSTTNVHIKPLKWYNISATAAATQADVLL